MKLDLYDKLVFGSLTTNGIMEGSSSQVIQLGNAGILPTHCEIFKSRSGTIVLEVKKDAVISVNGVRVIDATRKLKMGDFVLFGQSALFAIHLGQSPG